MIIGGGKGAFSFPGPEPGGKTCQACSALVKNYLDPKSFLLTFSANAKDKIMPSQRIQLLSASILTAALGSTPALAEEQPNMPPRQVLLEKAVELPANKVNTRVIRVTFPKGYKTPLHTHEGPGPRYVLKGRIKIEESGQAHEYGPGEVFWETGQWMTAENIGDGDAEVVIVELANPK
jgi:quercetin dioxygenase-like cupin family protein